MKQSVIFALPTERSNVWQIWNYTAFAFVENQFKVIVVTTQLMWLVVFQKYMHTRCSFHTLLIPNWFYPHARELCTGNIIHFWVTDGSPWVSEDFRQKCPGGLETQHLDSCRMLYNLSNRVLEFPFPGFLNTIALIVGIFFVFKFNIWNVNYV